MIAKTSLCDCIVVKSLFSLLLMQAVATRNKDSSTRIALNLLNILPFPDNQDDSGWDRAYELIPAAELAVEHVNMAPGLLPNHSLHLVTVESEPCTATSTNAGLTNAYAKLFGDNSSSNVIGMTGLFCPAVTGKIASVFSSPNLTFLQLEGSISSWRRNSRRHPWLIHFVPSSSVINEAVLTMMKAFQWSRISIIHRASSLVFTSDATDFVKPAEEAGFEVASALPLYNIWNHPDIFTLLKQTRARIAYIIAPDSWSAAVLCEAFRMKAVYPGYVYIFRENSMAGILNATESTGCTTVELRESMEGVFFIRYDLVADAETRLISKLTYREHIQEYIKRVKEIESSRNMSLDRDNVFANVMYDQVWAFALALRASIEKLEAAHVNLENTQWNQSSFIAETLRSQFPDISFQGATGHVSFNSDNEKDSLLRIFQVQDKREEMVGEFYSRFNESACLGNATQLNTRSGLCLFDNLVEPPPDSFETRIALLPFWFSTLIYIIIAICIAVSTITLITLYIVFRDRPEVKASSISLSVIMLIGCYFTYVGALMSNLSRGHNIGDFVIFTTICNGEVWFGIIGMTLVLSALLMRLLRVKCIFKAYGKLDKKFLNDRYLIMCILAICFGIVLIMVAWTVIDSCRKFTTVTYKSAATPPYFESLSYCGSVYWSTWLSLVLSYNGVLMVLVVILAVQTRKIKLSNFKDTKKINLFIITTCSTLTIALPLWFIVNMELQEFIGGHFLTTFMLICTGIYCQLFLFLPLIVNVLKNIRLEEKSQKFSLVQRYRRKEGQYSKIYY